MSGRRKVKQKRIKPRNPLALTVRTLSQRIKASAKTYTRKIKHKGRGRDNGSP